MAKNSIRDYSATASQNTDIDSIDIDENCPASNLNNSQRALMAHLKNVSTGAVNLETPAADQLNVDNLRLDGNTISSTDTNGDITLDPNGTGDVVIAAGHKLGAGTASPSSALHVYDGSNAKINMQTSTNTAFIGNISGSMEVQSADIIKFLTSGANERMRIDTNGNVGIGTNSPNNNSGRTTLTINNASQGGALDLEHNGTVVGKFICDGANTLGIQADGNRDILFKTNGNSRMLLSGNGNVGLNTTSPNSNALFHVAGNGNPSANMGVKGILLSHSSGNSAPIYFGTETNSSAKAIYMKDFYMTIRGHDNEGIKFDGSGSNVTRYRFDMGNAGNDCFNASNSANWNTTSDSRIKENVQTLPDGSIAKIKALRPVTFDYTDDWAAQKGWYNYTASDDDPHDLSTNGFNLNQKNNDIGWIAQEYMTVFPEDVHDRTETVNGQEVTDFKTMKPDSLVPHLVKALQEAIAKIETLETEMTALKARVTALEA